MSSFLSWLAARLGSFRYALYGLYLLTFEANARVHIVAAVCVFLLAYWLELQIQEWLWILTAVFLVFITEAFNTALEHLADAAMPEWHSLVGKAKDIAAGAVLLSSIFAILVGIIVLWPKLILHLA
jgi:diacylglycerol kinase (ATP)